MIMTDKKQISISNSLYRHLRSKIIFYAIIAVILIAGLFLKGSTIEFAFVIPYLEIAIDKKFLEFMPVLFLIWPCFMLIPTACNFKNKPIINKGELDNYTYEMIIPSVNSWLRQKHFILRIGIFFLMFLIVFPMLSILATTKLNSGESNNLYYLALFLYGTTLWRYLMIYITIKKHSIVISDHGITFPVFGFFKTRLLNVAYKDIEDSVIYGSRENVQMMLNEDIDQGARDLISSGSTLMQGICIWDVKGKYYIFSNKLIPAKILSAMYKQLPGDKGQFISEFVQ